MKNIRALIADMTPQFTSSERRIANVILADYPFTALRSIQELADKTGVSAPSVTRFVAKLGCEGFQDFQRRLIDELQEGQRSPRDLVSRSVPVEGDDFLSAYSKRLAIILEDMTAVMPPSQFNALVKLIADPSRNVFLIGGRVSDTVASFLAIHLRQIRAHVYHISDNPEVWPEYVLRMRKKDVVIFFDFRRYQQNLIQLAMTVDQSAQPNIVLVTDKWMSPIARNSKFVVALPIDAGTAWDTVVSVIAFTEALIVKVSECDWGATKKRIKEWDAIRRVTSLIDET
jgi:DNA-binding MurR/RpiR family transcriptional regulator